MGSVFESSARLAQLDRALASEANTNAQVPVNTCSSEADAARICTDFLDEVPPTTPPRVAALFVETNGAYFGIDDVDPWDITRDARLYAGPWPVVAHPPCERWGRYWFGGPSAKTRYAMGDDGGCFAHALWAVRMFGGVIEHPEASGAWGWFGLMTPPKGGGWIKADGFGWTCCVEQGHYGHRARKATWLYAVGAYPPLLIWGRARGKIRIDGGFHSAAERASAPSEERRRRDAERLSHGERAVTPPAFRDVLLSIARSARVTVAA